VEIRTVKPSDADTRKIAVETDTALAATHEELAKLRQRQGFAYDSLHRWLGDTTDRRGNWRMSNGDAYDKAVYQVENGEASAQVERAVDRLVEVERDIDLANERINELDVIWAQNGCWNRYFLVTNSNGHVHRNTTCSTCFPTTEYRWLVELADCDEDAMIVDYGEKACTVCFPDAPANPKFHGPGRRDREVQAARQAEKDARQAVKDAKRLADDEVFRTCYMNDRVETVAACKELIRRAIETKVELDHHTRSGAAPGFDAEAWARLLRSIGDNLVQQEQDAEQAKLVLLAREARHEGWGATQAQIDKIVASKAKAAAKVWG
jgi:hypothetical protein